jgi:hypothetical protein
LERISGSALFSYDRAQRGQETKCKRIAMKKLIASAVALGLMIGTAQAFVGVQVGPVGIGVGSYHYHGHYYHHRHFEHGHYRYW